VNFPLWYSLLQHSELIAQRFVHYTYHLPLGLDVNWDFKFQVDRCKVLCLDEADKLLSQDFKGMLDNLIAFLPPNRQVGTSSLVTMPNDCFSIIKGPGFWAGINTTTLSDVMVGMAQVVSSI
jgi:hypothetical protein